jgi:proton-dependent oligopeptide transporter, POT family
MKKRLGKTFWLLCSMEMWERLAYYGMRVVVPIYIAQADEPGGLHFTQMQKGSIYAWWFVFQSILPTFTGGFADRYGYKKTIFWSINLKVMGYLLMATQRSYAGFFIGTMILATGTAIFKPGIQGSLAQSLDRNNASKGWGIFYWLVNVGAMMGPPLAGMLRVISWSWVFYGCAAIVSINYLMMFTYADPQSGYEAKDSFFTVFKITVKNIVDARLIAFLIIMSGFWLMMYQLWDLHPNFIADWVDSGPVVASLPVPKSWTHETDRGVQMLQENLLNLNALLIVLFVVPVSILVAKMKTLSAMLIGMIVASAGIVVGGITMSGFMLLVGILFFSFGEMLTGPKKNEYLGLIAPKGKKGLYLGYVNIPVGIGGFVGSKLAGYLYGNLGEKAVLAQRYLAEKTDFLKARGLSPWDGRMESLSQTLGIPRSDAYAEMKRFLDLDGETATRLLWEAYEPFQVWYYFAAIGIVAIIALIIFNQRAKQWKDMNV